MYNVGVVGTGMIGSSLTALFLANNCAVALVGRSEEKLLQARNEISSIYDDFIDHQLMNGEQKKIALSHLTCSSDYSALKEADYILEAVFEDAAVKGSVYQKIEEACKTDAIIGSATSAISADVLAQYLSRKERFLVAHPWNPPHLVPLVEIVKSEYTSDSAAEQMKNFLLEVGKKPVVLKKNIAGFIGNRLQHAMFREALYLVEQGVATAEEIDDVVLYGFGSRYSSMHLFEHFDCASLPLNKQVHTDLFPTLCNADAPQQILLDKIAEGKLGMKTGEGMLNWHTKDLDDMRRRQRAPFYQFVTLNLPAED